MDICYATDDHFCMQTGVSMLSVLSHCSGEKIHFHVLDAGLSSKHREILSELAEQQAATVYFYDVRFLLEEISKRGQKQWGDFPTHATWARLFLPELLPQTVHKVLYLDGDVIAVQDWTPLIHMEMGNCTLAAVEDCVTSSYRQSVGLHPGSSYHNAGVLLFQMDEWRKTYQRDWLDTWLCTPTAYPMADQDVVNLMFEDRIRTLSLRYNYTAWFRALSLPDLQRLLEDHLLCRYTQQEVALCDAQAVFIHFNTCSLLVRPWYCGATDPASDRWLKFFRNSPWASQKLEPEPNNLSKGEQRDRKLYQLVGRKWFEPLHRIDYTVRSNAKRLLKRRKP